MKVESKWWFLVVGMAVGMMAGHVSGSRKSVVSESPAVVEGHAGKARSKSPSSATNAERIKAARLAQIREISTSKDYKAREAFTNSLRPGDVPDVLAAFLADAGLEGIDYQQKEILEKAVKQWVAEDINASLAWAGNLPQPKLRRYFQKLMLDEFAKTNPFNAVDRALEIEAGDAEFDASNIVSAGIRELVKTSGHEKMIAELVRKTAVKGGKRSSGVSQTFAEDFSYETLLNSLAEIQKQGVKFRYTPTGMLEAWAKRDPEAAHAWSAANGAVGFEEWDDVLSGVAATHGQQASGQWFLGKYTQASDEQRKMMVKAFDDTYREPAARMVLADSLARQMSPNLAEEFVDQVLKEHLGTYSDQQAEGLALLNWYSSPETRADALIKHAGYGGVDAFLERFPESRLTPYGVTREALEAAIQRYQSSNGH